MISDSVSYYDNAEDNRILGTGENRYGALGPNERARSTGTHVPLHDPKVLNRYPDAVVAKS